MYIYIYKRWLGTCLDFQPTSVESSRVSLIGCPWSQPNSTALMRPERPKQSDCLQLYIYIYIYIYIYKLIE